MEIDFHGAAGSLQHQPAAWVLVVELLKPLPDGLPSRTKPIAVVVLGPGAAHRTPQVDDFAAAVSLGFEQHRIHGRFRLQAGGPGLDRLGVRHLAAVAIHPGIQAHVLPLEGHRLFAPLQQVAAERCGH